MVQVRQVVRRLSVPLTDQDLTDLQRVREAPEPLSGVSATGSDASLVHALMERGLAAWRQEGEERGYAALSRDEEYAAHAEQVRAGRAQRRRPGNADDA